ncbi:hypothetical protein LVD17_27715 [Fulvivirga ulvae]|uniref:hypothetical protein n=1 Tax=Fulvivirga ulvae TaxID=2904245 RepID=UPI001F33F892|nr:hypothetical protein [Fulvivirga ulvae]UII32075.1 hypothetical protein LVD17_27715 [Fulvivirga ulvae]
MKNQQNQIHLNNILSCINEIENNCTDLSGDLLIDEELRMTLYRNLTMLGMEASRVDIAHPALTTLSSFEKADYIDGLGKDVYAVSQFIINDLEYLKKSLVHLSSRLTQSKKNKDFAMA